VINNGPMYVTVELEGHTGPVDLDSGDNLPAVHPISLREYKL
jgi:hypothetical protein